MKTLPTQLAQDIMGSIVSRREKSFILINKDRHPLMTFGRYGNYSNFSAFEIHLQSRNYSVDVSSSELNREFALLMDSYGPGRSVRMVIYDSSSPTQPAPVLEYGSQDGKFDDLQGFVLLGVVSPSGATVVVHAVFCGEKSSLMVDSSDEGTNHFLVCSQLISKLKGVHSVDESRTVQNAD